MLTNLLNAFTYWFNQDEPISWIKEEWSPWLWWAIIGIATLFLLIVIVLFFKALVRTRERRIVREAAHEKALAEKEQRRAEKAAEKAAEKERKQAAKEAEKARKLAEKENKRKQKEEKEQVAVVATAAPAEPEPQPAPQPAPQPVLQSAPQPQVVVVQSQPATQPATQQNYDQLQSQHVYLHVQTEPQPQQEQSQRDVERELVGISLDLGIVQREFELGEEFNCAGLVVHATYNLKPTLESLVDYALVDEDSFSRWDKINKVDGVFVIRPRLNSTGIKVVTVKYEDLTVAYTVSVKPPVVAEAPVVVEKTVEVPVQEPAPDPVVVERVVEKIVEVPVEKVVEKVVEKPVEKIVEKVVEKPVETVIINEESIDAGRLRYDKSFEARFIQSDDEVKHWYTEIKNILLSYKGCKSRISWKRETFKAKKEVVAKLVFRGNTLCLFVPLKVADYTENKEIEDASNLPVYEDTPVMIRLKNEKRKRLAITLIEKVMMERGILHGAHVSEDFYLPYEGVVELINRGLIKREIKTVEDEAIFERDKADEE